jgi:hypothetical protein
MGALLLLLSAPFCARAAAPNAQSIDGLRQSFQKPPDDARIMMRWWWFGAAVTDGELAREMRVMKGAGIGGVEIQPVYPLELDDPAHGMKNLPYLSDGFLARLRFAGAEAKRLGMRLDITLASGWPYGGPHIPVTLAAGRLRYERVSIPKGSMTMALPAMENGEDLIAAFLVDAAGDDFSAHKLQRADSIRDGRLIVPNGMGGDHDVLFFISSRTGQQVKRAAMGAEGFVLNHYDRRAIETHLSTAGDTLLRALGENRPYAVFSDSLEVFASDWTPDLLEEFRKRRGYDLTPWLPALVGDMGEETGSIRHDWGKTLTELANERYLTPIEEWARKNGTRFRSQTYGIPPVELSSNALVDLPEGEGPQWRTFSTSRWAASASHLYGRPVTSSETWTWLHSPAFRATPLDMKAEADLHFLQGINQLIGHGWPYSPPSLPEPGWRFYAAAVFNDHNPWFQVMPEITAYLQRVSFLLRQGEPDNDVAIYLPTDDAWAGFTPGHDSVNESMEALLGDKLIPDILNAGFNFDFIDDQAIATGHLRNRVLILPGVERVPPQTLRTLAGFVQKGGKVIGTRRVPTLAPGLMEAKTETAEIRRLTDQLFRDPGHAGLFVAKEEDLAEALPKLLAPDVKVGNDSNVIGFVHRKLAGADVYFVANTSNHSVETEASFRVSGRGAEEWNPFTGQAEAVKSSAAGATTKLALTLAPYESRIFVFSGAAQTDFPAPRKPLPERHTIDLSHDWTVVFQKPQRTIHMKDLHSWTDEPGLRFYSGLATYEKTLQLAPDAWRPGSAATINFGEGNAMTPVNTKKPGMRAWLESPVRECATVFINGKRAGSVWRPPYEAPVGSLLHGGNNDVQIVVGNLGINVLAGQTPPSYKLLNARYGVRFVPQDMDGLEPVPAGILGPVELVIH